MEFTTRLELRVPDLEDPSDRLIDVFERLEQYGELLGPAVSGSRDSIAVLCQVETSESWEAITVVLRRLADTVNYSLSDAKHKLISVECEPYIDPEQAQPVSRAEIARRLKLSEGRVHQLAQRADFPQPIMQVDTTRPLFRWGEVKAWNERRLLEAKPGRPVKTDEPVAA